jgi:hypothetical protein
LHRAEPRCNDGNYSMRGLYAYGHGIGAVDVLYERERLNAVLTVHPRGARHMIDPGRLLAATVRIYGEETTRRVYGEVLPVPAARVLEKPGGARPSLAGRELQFFDAPGHARHHVVLRDARTGRLGADLRRLIDAHVALAERWRGAGAQRNALLRKGIAELLREESRRQGWTLSDDELMRVFAIDVDLNAQGLEAWLDSASSG